MTEQRRDEIREDMRIGFAQLNERFDHLEARLEPLEDEFSERRGRRALMVVVGKVIAVISAFIAAVAALFGLGPN
jgi:tetrahydromethanopterin S-methyltransferase subunit G